jgi:hypothetical protein
MTIQEQFMVNQTEVMRQLLQTQQQLAQQLQNNPCGENVNGQPRFVLTKASSGLFINLYVFLHF